MKKGWGSGFKSQFCDLPPVYSWRGASWAQLAGGATAKNLPAYLCRRRKRGGFSPWVWKMPRRRERQLTPVSLPGESHGQRSLAGYSPCGCKRQTHLAHTHRHTHTVLDMLFFNWSIIALQRHISSCCTKEWISCMCTYIPSLSSLSANPCPMHPSGSSRNSQHSVGYSSFPGAVCPSVWHTGVCMCQCYSPRSSRPPSPLPVSTCWTCFLSISWFLNTALKKLLWRLKNVYKALCLEMGFAKLYWLWLWL